MTERTAPRDPPGIEIPPLATDADLDGLPHLQGDADAPLRQRRPGFAVRELIVCADPEQAAQAARAALRGGADQVELCLDALAQDAREPEPFSEGDDPHVDHGDHDDHGDHGDHGFMAPGVGGVAIHRLDDFRTAIRGIDLAGTHLSFSGGEATLPVLAYWLCCADEQDVDRAVLRGGLDLDPIARLLLRQVEAAPAATGADGGPPYLRSHRSSVEPVFDEAAAILRFCRRECPGIRPIVIDGQGYHLAGGTAVQELALTLAAAAESARQLTRRGLALDAVAAGASVRLQVSHELLAEIAKLRAFRLLWPRLVRALGGGDEACATVPELQAITSGRYRAQAFDLHTNLIRTALAGFAAVAGGCDVLAVVPHEEDPVFQDETARVLARNQQHLLREEAHLAGVADPAGGSFAIEVLTHDLLTAAWARFEEIEAAGGLLATMQSGALFAEVDAAARTRRAAFATRARTLVGINAFADLELGGPAPDAAEGARLASTAAEQAERLGARFLGQQAQRTKIAVDDALAALSRATPDELIVAARHAARAGASVAEIAQATWPPADVSFEHACALFAGTDGEDFEELRAAAEARAAAGDPLPEVLLLPIGARQPARARADFARDLLQAGGFPVADPGLRESAEDAANAVRSTTPAAVVVCAGDADLPARIDELCRALDGLEPMPLVIVAGAAPPGDDARVALFVDQGADAVRALARLHELL